MKKERKIQEKICKWVPSCTIFKKNEKDCEQRSPMGRRWSGFFFSSLITVHSKARNILPSLKVLRKVFVSFSFYVNASLISIQRTYRLSPFRYQKKKERNKKSICLYSGFSPLPLSNTVRCTKQASRRAISVRRCFLSYWQMDFKGSRRKWGQDKAYLAESSAACKTMLEQVQSLRW